MCINCRQAREAAEALVREITGAGGRPVAVAADVSGDEEVVRLFKRTARLGR